MAASITLLKLDDRADRPLGCSGQTPGYVGAKRVQEGERERRHIRRWPRRRRVAPRATDYSSPRPPRSVTPITAEHDRDSPRGREAGRNRRPVSRAASSPPPAARSSRSPEAERPLWGTGPAAGGRSLGDAEDFGATSSRRRSSGRSKASSARKPRTKAKDDGRRPRAAVRALRESLAGGPH